MAITLTRETPQVHVQQVGSYALDAPLRRRRWLSPRIGWQVFEQGDEFAPRGRNKCDVAITIGGNRFLTAELAPSRAIGPNVAGRALLHGRAARGLWTGTAYGLPPGNQ